MARTIRRKGPAARDDKKGNDRLKAPFKGVRSGKDMEDNSIGSRALSSSATDDSVRAVIRAAVRDKAMNADKLDDNSATTRVLATHDTNDDLRAVIRDAIRKKAVNEEKIDDNSGTARVIASFPHEVQADGTTPKDPDGNANTEQNANRGVTGAAVRTRTLRAYHFPDDEISPAKLKNIGPGKLPKLAEMNGDLTFGRVTGTLGVDRVAGAAELKGWKQATVGKSANFSIDGPFVVAQFKDRGGAWDSFVGGANSMGLRMNESGSSVTVTNASGVNRPVRIRSVR